MKKNEVYTPVVDELANGLRGKAVRPGLHQLFEWQVLRDPSTIAVVDGATRLTYRELNDSANRLARHLTGLGVGADVMVGIYLGRSHELIIAILAVLKAGGAYVPLDPDYPAERLSFMVHDAALSVIVTKQSLPEQLLVSGSCRIVALEVERRVIEGYSDRDLMNPIDPDSLLYVIYTSGSTGQPKGVMVTHRNVVRLFGTLGPVLGFSAKDVWSFYHSPAFGYSAWEIWGPLVHGGRLVIVPSSARIAPAGLRDFLRTETVSVLSLTPSAFRQIMLDPAFEGEESIASLRMIALSGEGVVGADLRRWFANHREGHPELIDTYAITETGGQVAWRRLGSVHGAREATHLLGEVLSDTQVHLLDDDLLPVEPGTDGELCVSGPGLARGYLNRPDLTRMKFVQDPLDPGQRLYRTGDHGRVRADGRIALIGRGDDQVKIRGFRVELGEIEAALRDHSRIREAAVQLREDDSQPARLVAYIAAQQAGGESVRLSVEETGDAELWPSLGEYQVYDEVLYDLMTSETVRNAAYKEAINRHVKDKVVLDIGTGQHAILARFCIEAGARRVYAIEVLEDAYREAAKLVEESGLSDRIVVIHGDSTTVQLPELVDVCTEGIIGNIGSSDGIIPIMNDARRWFRPGAVAIPNRCITYFAAVQLPDSLHETPRFGSLPRRYVEKIFAQAGRRFDIRLCVRNFPASHLVSDTATYEDLDFGGTIDPEKDGETILTVTKAGRFDGLLLWTHVITTEGVAIDYLDNQQAWLPVYFPLSDEGVQVQVGDSVLVRWKRTLCENGLNPDYFVAATAMGPEGRRAELSYRTKHHETGYLQTEIHRRLFAHWEDPQAVLSPDGLRAYLEKRLPDYMIPSAFVFLDELPRNANGKLDRRRLPAPGTERPNLTTPFAGPESPLQAKLAAIWSEVLKVDSVGLDDNFFDLGGQSLIAAQIMARIAARIRVELPLSVVFDHPSVRKLSAIIEPHQDGMEEASAPQRHEVAPTSQDERFMRTAIEQATRACQLGGVPFGACVVKDDKVLASVYNGVSNNCDPTAHAEVRAIREACTLLGSIDLSGCTVFSTCEPCPMCFAACHEARISRIVHGAWLSDAERVGLGTLSIPAAQLRALGRASLTLTPQVLRQEVVALLEDWRKQRSTATASVGLYGDDEGFEAYDVAVGCSNLLERAMEVIDPLLEKHPTATPFRLLDIGAGTGTLTLRILENLARRGIDARADCIEPSPPAMRRLEGRIQEAGLGRCLGKRHPLNWEQFAHAGEAARYDMILAHHSLYYAALSESTVRPLFTLLAATGHAVLFMDAEESPVSLIREVVGRHLGRRKLQLSGSRDLQASLYATKLTFERLDLDVTWDVTPLFEPQNSPVNAALTAFLALIPPSQITASFTHIVSEETRALAILRAGRSLLSQSSRVFILHAPKGLGPAGEPVRTASVEEIEEILADLESLTENRAQDLADEIRAPRKGTAQ